VAIKLMVTIEESFGIIQKLLVPGFETRIRKSRFFRSPGRRMFEPSH
jgi:hypothetical protein